MEGYRITPAGHALVELFAGPADIQFSPNETILAQALCALVKDGEESFGYSEAFIDEPTPPYIVRSLLRRGYIEQDVIPVVERYLERQSKIRIRRDEEGRWRMGLQ